MADPSDIFADALAKMGKTSDDLAKAAEGMRDFIHTGSRGLTDAAERLVRASESMERAAEERRKAGHEEDAPAKPKRKKKGPFDFDDDSDEGKGKKAAARPRGFVERAFDDSRFGKAYHNAQERFRHRFGSEGPNHTGGLGKMGGMAARAAGVVGVVVAAGEAINTMRKRIEEWTTAAIESKRRLGESSGAMNSVFANKDVQDMLRDMKVGNRLAPSTQKLVEAEGRRKDAQAPFQIAIDQGIDKLLTQFNDGMAIAYEEMRKGINKLIEQLGGKKDFLEALKKNESVNAFDAMTMPGGVVDIAKQVEEDAKDALNAARDVRDKRAGLAEKRFGKAGLP